MKRISVLATIAALLSPVAPAIAEPPAANATAPYKTVSSEAFSKKPEGATLIDVREATEWAETGTPKGAALVSISRPDFVDAVTAQVGGDKSKPVALICRSGNRSSRAAAQLAAAGFTNVINIGDGMSGRDGVGPGWIATKLPTEAYSARP
jgi:rhodanese-related sulfurtransferase